MFELMVVHKNSSGTIDSTKESSWTNYKERRKFMDNTWLYPKKKKMVEKLSE